MRCKKAQNSRISDRNAFASQHASSCESICKRKSYIPTPDPSPREGRANLRDLSRPLQRREELTCKEISYNSLRNYAL